MRKLKTISDSIVQLDEAKTKVLTAFEDTFGKDVVYSSSMDFEFDGKTFSKAYAILNAYLFENKLNQKKTASYKKMRKIDHTLKGCDLSCSFFV